MMVIKFWPGGLWYAEVLLNEKEWPPIDEKDHWLDRPVRRWVQENTSGQYFFTASGTILFTTESDLTAFVLAWS